MWIRAGTGGAPKGRSPGSPTSAAREGIPCFTPLRAALTAENCLAALVKSKIRPLGRGHLRFTGIEFATAETRGW